MHRHEIIELSIACTLVVVGVYALLAGFYAVPIGEIHSSVLIAFGEILTFVGAILGIDYHYRSLRGKK